MHHKKKGEAALTHVVSGQGGEGGKIKREKGTGLRGTIPGRHWHDQPHMSFAMPILSSCGHASALPYTWYQVSRLGSPSRLRVPACLQRMYVVLTISGTYGTYSQHESLPVRWPSIVGCPRNDPSRFTCIYRFYWYMFRDVRAWMLNASGITLANLHAYSDSTCFEMYVHGWSMRQA